MFDYQACHVCAKLGHVFLSWQNNGFNEFENKEWSEQFLRWLTLSFLAGPIPLWEITLKQWKIKKKKVNLYLVIAVIKCSLSYEDPTMVVAVTLITDPWLTLGILSQCLSIVAHWKRRLRQCCLSLLEVTRNISTHPGLEASPSLGYPHH